MSPSPPEARRRDRHLAIPRLHWEYGEYDLRVLDTFDWYSPRYQSKHTYPEVCRWFREAELEHVEPLDAER